MLVQVKRRQEQAVSTWAGGSTTELAIFPEGATCAARNFGFRVSSATVELAESDFSDFSGYTRHIMPLEGSMELRHAGRTQVTRLQPCQLYTFDGGWQTHSAGTCVDFNLIHRANVHGELQVLCAESVFVPVRGGHTGLYALCDGLAVSGIANSTAIACSLSKGDYLWIDSTPEEQPTEMRLKTGMTHTTGGKAAVAVLVLIGRNTD